MSNNPKNSKCWDCKFGMCSLEMNKEIMFAQPKANYNPFEIEKDEEDHLTEKIVDVPSVKTICYWRPNGIENTPPILLSFVKECNRYERNH